MAIYLYEARLRAGLKQAEIARKMGVSPVTVWKWEKHRKVPKPAEVKMYAELCGLTAADIFLPKSES